MPRVSGVHASSLVGESDALGGGRRFGTRQRRRRVGMKRRTRRMKNPSGPKMKINRMMGADLQFRQLYRLY